MQYNSIKIFCLGTFFPLFISCSSNLDDFEQRLYKLEIEVWDLQSAFQVLQNSFVAGKVVTSVNPLNEEQGWIIGFSDNSTIKLYNGTNGDAFLSGVDIDGEYVTINLADGKSFMFKMASKIDEPRLLSMEFYSKLNPQKLVENVSCTIIGDSVIDCWVRHIMPDKNLIPHFTYVGDNVYIEGQTITSDKTSWDFRKPFKLTVKSRDRFKDYTIYVHAFTGLPVLWIETEDRKDITSKDKYLRAHFRLVEDVMTRSSGEELEMNGYIKGRGNSSWDAPKKPYRLKFDTKMGFINEPKDKSWVLLANYYDKTMIRNATAFYMSSISNLEYTPRYHFVEMMLNGRYNGTYQLGDHLKISKNRVNVGDDGFLLEIDAKAESDEMTIKVGHISHPINIKDPDVVVGDENYEYIKSYLEKVDEVLFSDNFTDANEGWQKYMDMDSFVDWYIINEIAKNNDACFYTSCYMNLSRDGKLKMGPVWDFDIAFGNVNYNGSYLIEGFWVKNVPWYSRLFQDPDFVTKVKERFAYYYDSRMDIYDEINANARYLRYSVEENNSKWGVLYNYTWPNYDIWGSYQNEIQSMKLWLNARLEWLKVEFEKL